MFNNFFGFISKIGIQDHYSYKFVKRITLTNQFSFIALFIFIVSGIHNISLGDLYSGLILEGFSLVCILGIWINHKHHHNFAISFLFLTICGAVFYFDSYSGWNSGTYLYYFPIILGIAFVFDFNTDKVKMFIHGGIILCFILINLVTRHKLFESTILTDAARYQMFIFNIMFSTATVGFFIYLTVATNLRENVLFEQRIRERKNAEQIIQQALTEKEILLSELHHRVKNNMAIISGLFSFAIDTTQNNEAKGVLTESRNRVQSMALIHNKLYKSKDLSKINFSEYVTDLLKEIQASYPSLSNTIVIQKDISDVQLGIGKAIPCGLILNELLTNCYKHAFKGKESGNIHIQISCEAELLKLTVQDNGVGLKPDYDKNESIGLTVVQALSDQLEGNYKYSSEEGTHFELCFAHA